MASAASKVRRGDCEGQILGFGQSRFLECDQVASQYTSASRQGSEMDVK